MTADMSLVATIRSRIGQDFDGECHLTEAEALQITDALQAANDAERQLQEALSALKPFADLIGRPNALNDPRLANDTFLELRLFNAAPRSQRTAQGLQLANFREAARVSLLPSTVGGGRI